jgi:hypothetical protein
VDVSRLGSIVQQRAYFSMINTHPLPLKCLRSDLDPTNTGGGGGGGVGLRIFRGTPNALRPTGSAPAHVPRAHR